MFIDTHCHLSKEFYEDIEEVLKEDQEAGISKIIVSSCEVKEYQEVIKYASENSFIYLSLGIHPEYASTTTTDKDLETLESLLTNTKKIVALGEIGLDYYYTKENKQAQQDLFRKQLQLAEKLHLPVVIHSRDATEDTINILKEFPNVKGDIHCFSGSIETANIYIKMGYKIGIGGVVTFKNSKLYEVVDAIDIENIILETDSPYLTPDPYRGKQNSSKYIPIIAKKIADIKNISLEEVGRITSKTAESLFKM